MKVAKWSVLVILLLLIGGVGALVGERVLGVGVLPNETRARAFQDWRVICPPPVASNAPNCVLTHDALLNTGSLWLTLSISDPAPGSALSVKVSHGVMLEPGLGFSIGTGPGRTVPYETCIDSGCVAQVIVDPDMLKALLGNPNGQVTVMLTSSTPPARIQFSLKGFAEGYSDLQRVKEQRTSFSGFFTR